MLRISETAFFEMIDRVTRESRTNEQIDKCRRSFPRKIVWILFVVGLIVYGYVLYAALFQSGEFDLKFCAIETTVQHASEVERRISCTRHEPAAALPLVALPFVVPGPLLEYLMTRQGKVSLTFPGGSFSDDESSMDTRQAEKTADSIRAKARNRRRG